MSKIIRLDLSDDEQIEKIGKAISDKVRRKIIKMSTEGSYSVMEIAERLNMPVSTVSFHLKILKEAGFIQILPIRQNAEMKKSFPNIFLWYGWISDCSMNKKQI